MADGSLLAAIWTVFECSGPNGGTWDSFEMLYGVAVGPPKRVYKCDEGVDIASIGQGGETEHAEEARLLAIMIDQLLPAGAELQTESLVHGYIGTQVVCAGQAERISLIDTAIGPLTYWNQGCLFDDHATPYYPPEWKTS